MWIVHIMKQIKSWKLTIPLDPRALLCSPTYVRGCIWPQGPDGNLLGHLPCHDLFCLSGDHGGKSEWFGWTPVFCFWVILFHIGKAWWKVQKREASLRRNPQLPYFFKWEHLSDVCPITHMGPGTQSMNLTVEGVTITVAVGLEFQLEIWSKCEVISLPVGKALELYPQTLHYLDTVTDLKLPVLPHLHWRLCHLLRGRGLHLIKSLSVTNIAMTVFTKDYHSLLHTLGWLQYRGSWNGRSLPMAHNTVK